ncbi:hypothetical protein [Streptomyces sp. NPDC051776]|uniref:hypothetical protein n=1 Tax=Streptomyces sp. NPDC051776 TaxID=3155414 RepID=UPI003430B016
MNPGRFEERLLQELKARIEQRPSYTDAAESMAFASAESGGWGRVFRVGLAAGVAVAMVATAFLLGQNGPDGSHDTVTGSRTEDGGPRERIVNAAYTVERKAAGVVKLTIEDPSGKPDIEGMRKDLESMGVPARVYAGDPDCPNPRPGGTPSGDPDPTGKPTGEPSGEPTGEPSRTATEEPTGSPTEEPTEEPTGTSTAEPTEEPTGTPTETSSGSTGTTDSTLDEMLEDGRQFRIEEERGKLVAYVKPDLIPKGSTLTFGFPLAKTDPEHGLSIWQVGLEPGDGPGCLPAVPADAVKHRS